MSDYMAAQMDGQIEGAISENERLRLEVERLESALQCARAEAAAEERHRCRDLVRRHMPAGWTALYDAMSDPLREATSKAAAPLQP